MTNKFLKQASLVIMAMTLSVGVSAWAGTHYDEVGQAVRRQKADGYGTGFPTVDLGNIVVGLVDVESVFGNFHHTEIVRDMDTRACGEIGVKALAKGGGSTGNYCCYTLWETEGHGLRAGRYIKKTMGGNLGGWDEHRKNKLKTREQFMEYCCKLSDDKKEGDEKVFCTTVAQEKAGCVKGELSKNGQDLESAMSACEVTCDPKYYGTLKHNEGEEYSDEQVDNLMKTCTMAEVDWAPSTSVPGASEFAPTVPSNVKKNLAKEEKNND